MPTQTITTALARSLSQTQGALQASIIGQPGGWMVMLKLGATEKPLTTQRTHKPRLWRSLDTCMAYLKSDLQIVRNVVLDASGYSTQDAAQSPRADSSARLKRAHEAAAYDAWFRAQVQASIDDPRPSIPQDTVQAEFAQRRMALRAATRA